MQRARAGGAFVSCRCLGDFEERHAAHQPAEPLHVSPRARAPLGRNPSRPGFISGLILSAVRGGYSSRGRGFWGKVVVGGKKTTNPEQPTLFSLPFSFVSRGRCFQLLMFSCQTQVSGCVLLTPRHIWLRHIWLPREGARSAIRPDKPFRFGDVLCSGGGLSRWPRRAGACPPQVVPSSGQGNDAAKVLAGMRPHRRQLCPSAPVSGGCNGLALGYQ